MGGVGGRGAGWRQHDMAEVQFELENSPSGIFRAVSGQSLYATTVSASILGGEKHYIKRVNVSVNSKTAHPLPANPQAFDFFEIFWSNSPLC